jgi:hypothetical protein
MSTRSRVGGLLQAGAFTVVPNGELGRGGFGKVIKAKWVSQQNKPVAVKEAFAGSEDSLFNELMMLCGPAFDHENTIEPWGALFYAGRSTPHRPAIAVRRSRHRAAIYPAEKSFDRQEESVGDVGGGVVSG